MRRPVFTITCGHVVSEILCEQPITATKTNATKKKKKTIPKS